MKSRGAHIKIESLSHRYGFRSAYVLDDVSFSIEPGSRIALVGRSGCGKSTLLQLLAGLSRPTKGSIHIDGCHVRSPSARWNVMFQKPSLYPWMSVERNASLGMYIAGKRNASTSRVAELLELVGLSEFAKTNVQQLSGGQQQRVALARSLATRPQLLMLDEPFAALDEMTRTGLQEDVTRITRQLDMTQIIVTHDIDEAITMADRILVLSSCPGKIIGDLDNDIARAALKASIRSCLSGDLDRDAFGEALNHRDRRNRIDVPRATTTLTARGT